jgi:hypothetical protein
MAPETYRMRDQTTPVGWVRPDIVVVEDLNRAGIPAGLQLICGAGPFELEVLVQDLEREKRLEIAGQVTRAGSVYDPVGGLPVELVSEEDCLSGIETTTDGFGEFDLVSARGSRYGLRLGDGPGAPCVLVWEAPA